MSIKIMTRVWEHSQSSGSDLLLLLAIADFADDDGLAFPSIPTLAAKIRMSERQTMRLINRLCQADELYRIGRGTIGRANRYAVIVGLTPDQVDDLVKRRGDILSGVGGDNLSGGGCQVVTPDKLSGVTQLCQGGGDIAMSGGGDIAMSPDPSLNRHSIINDGADSSVRQVLADFGIDAKAIPNLDDVALDDVQGWIEHARTNAHKLKNPQGLVVARLRAGDPPPRNNKPKPNDNRKRFISGEFAEFVEH